MMAPRLPEAMWEPLPETADGAIAWSARERIVELLADRSALALGPGLGLDDETVRLVHAIVSEHAVPTVIDADGLNALQGHLDIVPAFEEIGLTPHPGEAARLLGSTTANVQNDRLAAVRELAERVDNHVLLKGYRTLVTDPGGHTIVNLTGNPGLATAGSGDVLTGIIGGMLAQGSSISNALVVGAYVHGLAGDLAAARARRRVADRDRHHRQAPGSNPLAGSGLTLLRGSTSPEATLALARELAEHRPDCPAYYLEGDLGAGKTLFTKGLATFYGIDPSVVVSPTFALVNRYGGGSRVMYHIDLYRIEHERELDELGIEEMEAEGALLVVEWAEKLGRHRRDDACVVRFEVSGPYERQIHIDGIVDDTP